MQRQRKQLCLCCGLSGLHLLIDSFYLCLALFVQPCVVVSEKVPCTVLVRQVPTLPVPEGLSLAAYLPVLLALKLGSP